MTIQSCAESENRCRREKIQHDNFTRLRLKVQNILSDNVSSGVLQRKEISHWNVKLKPHSHQAKTETKISFDICRFLFDIFAFASVFGRCEWAFNQTETFKENTFTDTVHKSRGM